MKRFRAWWRGRQWACCERCRGTTRQIRKRDHDFDSGPVLLCEVCRRRLLGAYGPGTRYERAHDAVRHAQTP